MAASLPMRRSGQTRVPEGLDGSAVVKSLLDRFRVVQPLASGTLELLKWLAVILMTADHINLHLLAGKYPFMYGIGRVALPLFVFVLAYNLAQPQAKENGAALRVLERLFPVAVLSSLPYMELSPELYALPHLNVLFTLAAGTAVVALIERPTRLRQILAVLLFAGSGYMVDYGWTGIGLFICCWHLFRNPNYFWAVSTAIHLVLLGNINMNQWALAVLPIIGLAFIFPRLNFPRLRNALYYYYPLHLIVIAALRITVFDR